MNSSRINGYGQTKVYIGKCFRAFVNEKQWKNFISTLIISALLVLVMSDKTFIEPSDTQFSMFAMICGCIWVGVFNSIQSVCKERGIIKHEHHTGLRISSYVIAHAVYELVICALEALIITLTLFIANGAFGLSGVIFPFLVVEAYIAFLLIVFAADMLGLLVSCIVKNTNMAMTVMPFILIVQLLFGGVMFDLGNAEFVKNGTISYWGVNALCSSSSIDEAEPAFDLGLIDLEDVTEEDLEYYEEEYGIPKAITFRYSGLEFKPYKSTPAHVLLCWLILIAQSALFIALGILFLKRVKYDKR